MKVSTSALLSGLCWSAQLVSAQVANIYTFDPQSPPRPQPRSLSPVAARLVLAQRAGVEDFHRADLDQEDVIDAINDYGLRTPMFASGLAVKKAVILLEDEASIPSLQPYTSFSLDSTPSTKSTEGLFVDLAKQSDPNTFSSLSDDDVITLVQSKRYLSGSGNLFHLVHSPAEFEKLFLNLVNSHKWSITAMTIPKTVDNKDTTTWGSYELPNQQSLLKKRQNRIPEQIFSDAHEPVQSIQPLAASNNNTYNNTTPLRGILPACYTTKEHCEKTTRNCTGHGSCSKKYRDPDSGSSGLDCYSCSCTATVVENENGKKTTKWGGPACQKKDISIEFWLIALFTVGLMFLVSFAVGTVWEMGSEELPSVIGAGVSGPSARK